MAQRNESKQVERRQEKDGHGQEKNGHGRPPGWRLVRHRGLVPTHAVAACLGSKSSGRLCSVSTAPNDIQLGRRLGC